MSGLEQEKQRRNPIVGESNSSNEDGGIGRIRDRRRKKLRNINFE